MPTAPVQPPRELIPEGVYVGIIYSLVQIGTVSGYHGKMQNQVRVTIEIPSITREFDGVTKPLVVGQEMTYAMSEKAFLRKLAETVVGTTLTDEEAAGYDVAEIVGKAIQIQIKHKTSQAGNAYEKIDTVMSLPAGTPAPKQFNESVTLFHEEWDQAVFDKLPEFMQKKIEESEEYQNRIHGRDGKQIGETNDIPF